MCQQLGHMVDFAQGRPIVGPVTLAVIFPPLELTDTPEIRVTL